MTRDRAEHWADAALDSACVRVAAAGPGERNATLLREASAIYQIVAGGHLDATSVRVAFEQAASATGLRPAEVSATLHSAERLGSQHPRDPQSRERPARRRREPARPTKPREPPAAQYPPADEIAALWAGCRPVGDDAEVAAYLRRRALAPERVELYDLARALPQIRSDSRCGAWARCGRHTWYSGGWRLVVPAWGVGGVLVSLHVRQIGEPPWPDAPKTLWPKGYQAGGLVFANGVARQLLGAADPEGVLAGWTIPIESWWCRRVIIVEGLPDYLSCASAEEETARRTEARAVFGVDNASWTPEIAARIPRGCTVTIATHHDAAGDAYAQRIGRSLKGCEVRRLCPRT